ncbi:MAG: hypothetical protein ACE5E9_07615 [Nitrospinaceae bacterium]
MKTLLAVVTSALFFFGIPNYNPASPVLAQANLFSWQAFLADSVTGDAGEAACGEKMRPPKYYEDVSLYSLIAGFALLFLGIFLDKKLLKVGSFVLALLPFLAWGYVNYFVDYDQLKRITFNYNAAAENTLANIAEAQDRYKSEHDTFLKDLVKLDSHTAGAHGTDPCVKILKIEATWNHWSAQAKHVSSPDIVTWDSERGSSLKKG